MNKYTATSGKWGNLPFSYSTGTVERKNGSRSVTFTFAQQKATIQLEPTSSFPQNISTYFLFHIPVSSKNHATDVTGNFTYRGGEDFATKAIHANWNQDRVVFYQDAKFIEHKWVCFVRSLLPHVLRYALTSYYLIFWVKQFTRKCTFMS
jgi:hypothetical protein